MANLHDGGDKSTKGIFTLSSSRPSARSVSVDPEKTHIYTTETSGFLIPAVEEMPPGRRAVDVYEASLSWWRAAIRRKIVASVRKESVVIARMQDYLRTPWLDAYFVYTSSLGTHTFFMIVLPALFFFGHYELGHGIVMILGLGVYLSSFMKDLFCSPRPFAPPVTRLTIGTHHLEYGFPSTHSTNSVSIALFLFGHIYVLAHNIFSPTTEPSHFSTSGNNSASLIPQTAEPALSQQSFTYLSLVLAWYTFSIVFGRIYTAMHSFSDCIMGIIIGAGIWWAHGSFPGIPYTLTIPSWALSVLAPLIGDAPIRNLYLFRGAGLGRIINDWVSKGGWEIPAILVPIGVIMVNQHPVPVDDCPCFEDAIAFVSVVLGMLVGRWGVQFFRIHETIQMVIMPGSGWVRDATMNWIQVERTWGDVGLWWSFAVLKLVVGILIIFAWRIIAKSTLHLILPPTFRFFARAVSLPNRRFYTPATQYNVMPSEFSQAGGGLGGLRPIPSVIDLPSTGGVGVEVGGIGSGNGSGLDTVGGVRGLSAIKSRNASGRSSETQDDFDYVNEKNEDAELRGSRYEKANDVKHYDADVLTKAIVYAGIGMLATEVIPILFDLLGWGVQSGP